MLEKENQQREGMRLLLPETALEEVLSLEERDVQEQVAGHWKDDRVDQRERGQDLKIRCIDSWALEVQPLDINWAEQTDKGDGNQD